MNPSVRTVTPDRLQIRQGGGCMSVFGLPFFAAGIFLFLTLLGIVPVSNANDLPMVAWPFMILMAIAFTGVGGTLALGRAWTTLDRAERAVIKQWGPLIPMHERRVPMGGSAFVSMGFVRGDSDSADKFPIALKDAAGAQVPLGDFTDCAQARACAIAVAQLLHLEIEDASTDHPVRLPVSQFDAPIRQRLRREDTYASDVLRPPGARSEVTREMGAATIVIPSRPSRLHMLFAGLVPLTIGLVVGPVVSAFFRQTHTPDAVAWSFLGFLVLFFVVFPLMSIVNGLIRSRRGATIIEVSREGLRVHERGAWRTRTVASLDAADILDIDYSSRDSSVAASKRAVEQQVQQQYPSSSEVSPAVERVVARLTRFVHGNGVTIKTRTGLTTFGQGLEDDEIRYLHSVVRRALVE